MCGCPDASIQLLDKITDQIIKKIEDKYTDLTDYTDERCQTWIDTLPELAKLASKKLPVPEKYDPDKWKNDAQNSNSTKEPTDYYKFHKAASQHLVFVQRELNKKGLSLLGQASFASKEDLGDILHKNLRIKSSIATNPTLYWEVENNSKEENVGIQLWDKTPNNEKYNFWQIRYVSTTPLGDDLFAIINMSLPGMVATLNQNRLISRTVHREVGLSMFKIARYIEANKSTTYTFHNASTNQDLISEDGELRNGVSIVSTPSGDDHIEWSRWEFELI